MCWLLKEQCCASANDKLKVLLFVSKSFLEVSLFAKPGCTYFSPLEVALRVLFYFMAASKSEFFLVLVKVKNFFLL